MSKNSPPPPDGLRDGLYSLTILPSNSVFSWIEKLTEKNGDLHNYFN
jgi:hypothetical protein